MATISYDIWVKVDVSGWTLYGPELLELPFDHLTYVDPGTGATEDVTVDVPYGYAYQVGGGPVEHATWHTGLYHYLAGQTYETSNGEGDPVTRFVIFDLDVVDTVVNPDAAELAAFGTLDISGQFSLGPDGGFATHYFAQIPGGASSIAFEMPDYYWVRQTGSIEAGFTNLADDFSGDLAKFPQFLDIFNPALANIGLDALGGDDVLRLGAGGDSATGNLGNDSLVGGGGADTLAGGADHDTLQGGAGNDDLSGDAGNDRLTGNAGADVFYFGPGFGRDRITDFTDDLDSINLSALFGPTSVPSVADILALYARETAGNVVLNFGGGDVLTVVGLGSAALLLDDILLA